MRKIAIAVLGLLFIGTASTLDLGCNVKCGDLHDKCRQAGYRKLKCANEYSDCKDECTSNFAATALWRWGWGKNKTEPVEEPVVVDPIFTNVTYPAVEPIFTNVTYPTEPVVVYNETYYNETVPAYNETVPIFCNATLPVDEVPFYYNETVPAPEAMFWWNTKQNKTKELDALEADFYAMDLDGSGFVDLIEFTSNYEIDDSLDADLINFVFNSIDVNGNQKLSWREMRRFVKKENGPASLVMKPQITFECTYRCSVWNTCMVSGAINGNTAGCGAEPAGCDCVW
jgi:hypothetical protein